MVMYSRHGHQRVLMHLKLERTHFVAKKSDLDIFVMPGMLSEHDRKAVIGKL